VRVVDRPDVLTIGSDIGVAGVGPRRDDDAGCLRLQQQRASSLGTGEPAGDHVRKVEHGLLRQHDL